MNIHEKILEERGSRYGEFDNLAEISQTLKDTWYMKANLDFKEPTDAMNEAMEMVLHKLSRMINGDRYYEDNIIDIQNYLELYRREVIKNNTNTPKKEKDSTELKEELLSNISNEEKDILGELINELTKKYNFE